MKITGQILKENRERKGISISEVAIATKINNKTIIAMEAGDLERLPPKTFLRGFVKAYSTYLELDSESILATFFEEMGSTKPKAPTGSVSTTSSSPRSSTAVPRPASREPNDANDTINPKASLPVKAGAVVAILLLVVLIVFFKNKMESYEREAVVNDVPANLQSLPEVSPGESPAPSAIADATSGTAAVNSDAPAAGASPEPNDAIAMSGAPSPTPSGTPQSLNTAAASVKPTATPVIAAPIATATPIAAVVIATPTPTAVATPAPTPSPTPKPSPTPGATPAGRAQNVVIEALDSVEVDITADGEPTKKVKLTADSVHSVKAKRKVILRFSDGGSVNLIVNGNDRGVPGDLGKPARVELQ